VRTRLLHPEQLLEALAPPAPTPSGVLVPSAPGPCICAGAIPPAVKLSEAAWRGEGGIGVFGGQMRRVGAVQLGASRHGGRSDQRWKWRLEIGGDGRLMETRRRGHGLERMVHLHTGGRSMENSLNGARIQPSTFWTGGLKLTICGVWLSALPPDVHSWQEQALTDARAIS
jgi:hypothetical protein